MWNSFALKFFTATDRQTDLTTIVTLQCTCRCESQLLYMYIPYRPTIGLGSVLSVSSGYVCPLLPFQYLLAHSTICSCVNCMVSTTHIVCKYTLNNNDNFPHPIRVCELCTVLPVSESAFEGYLAERISSTLHVVR